MTSVSVIMAAHNAASTVVEAVCSVQYQTLEDWELIAVDDGSTDETGDLLHALAERDPRIKVLSSAAPLGSGAARNRAIGRASSPLVAVHDADDIALPHRLEAQVRFMESSDAVAVSSRVAEFGSWGGPVVADWPTSSAEVRRRQRRRQMPIPHPACTFRRDVVMEVGGYDEACLRAQDYALMLRIGHRPMELLPEVHMFYRTERPVPLSYVIASGRWGALASSRNTPNGYRDVARLNRVQRRLVDTRSFFSWVVRNSRELGPLSLIATRHGRSHASRISDQLS